MPIGNLSQNDRPARIPPLDWVGYNVLMSKRIPPTAAPRVLFFGLPAGTSAAVLAELLATGMDLSGVVVPAIAVPHLLPEVPAPVSTLKPLQTDALPLAGDTSPADTLGIAWKAGLPVLAVGDFAHPHSLAALRGLAADVAVVACFSHRIPAVLLSIPSYGFLNIHPSLLPDYRGPTPVFWQLRDGARTGVTVHFMDEGLDTGDIAAQAAHPLPDGIHGREAERALMLAGVTLLRGVLADLGRGSVRRRPQPPGGHSFSFPEPADFVLSTEWPARRAYNFMRGTAHYGLPYPVEIAGKMERLAIADHFEPAVELDRPSVRHGRSIIIRFNPGILYARMVN